MRLFWLVFPVGVLGAAAAGGYLYRQHEIAVGNTAFAQNDFVAAYAHLSPFSGWNDAQAESELAQIYVRGLGVPPDDDKAFALAQRSADAGNASGEYLLGRLYYLGHGVPSSPAKAAYWTQKSADQRLADAENFIGNLYTTGEGVAQDYVQAAEWFQKAVDQGNVPAEVSLGLAYGAGTGVPQDDEKALALLNKAAAQGDADAEFAAGLMYLEGKSVPPNTKQALTLFTAAAKQGDDLAENELGEIYSGQDPWAGTSIEDDTLAYMFYDLAAAQGYRGASDAKLKVGQTMTQDEITSAQRMSSSWKPGTTLPATATDEDLAAQYYIHSANLSYADIQTTKVWFFRSFGSGHQVRNVVFLKTKGENCFRCGAKITAVTFSGQDASSTEWASYHLQPAFTIIGMNGDLVDWNDILSPDEPKIETPILQYDLGNNRYAIFVPDAALDRGEAIHGFVVLVYDGNVNYGVSDWVNTGFIPTSDNTSGNCENGKPVFGSVSCFSWEGQINMLPAQGNGWPEFVVHATGTMMNQSNDKIVPAMNIIFKYDGANYVPVSKK